jgi:hypothetical protein
MNVSVIIPWRNRPAIRETLSKNAERLIASGAEVLIVNGGGDLKQLRELTSNPVRGAIRLVDLPGVGVFNKSECLNIGAFSSRTGHVFVLDADIVLTTDFLEQALEAISCDACFVSVAEVIESEPNNLGLPRSLVLKWVTTTELLYEGGRTASIQFGVDKYGIRTGPGLVVVKKEHFIAVGGFNSKLQGWGYEDYDFQIRLQLGLGLKRISLGQVQHLSHPRSQTAGASNARNTATCKENYERGELQGTFSADVSRWEGKAVEHPCRNY